MAAQTKRPGSDVATVAVPFSYAQAAKGLSSSSTSAGAPSKPASGAITPSKDSAAPPPISTAPSGLSWADDTEEGVNSTEKESDKASTVRESQTNGIRPTSKQISPAQPKPASSLSSPDFGTSSSSTLVKDDDVSSLPNASSESTWENKSQTSNTADKAAEANENIPEKSKSKDVEKAPQKSLQEAPIPMVNIWKQRAVEAAKAKAAVHPTSAKTSVSSNHTVVNGTSPGHNDKPNGVARSEPKKKGKTSYSTDDADAAMAAPKEKRQNTDMGGRPREDDRPMPSRRGGGPDMDADKSKKNSRARAEKDSKAMAPTVPPPVKDQESWPTPDIALDEGKKKTSDKSTKVEKERNQSSSSKPHGKQEWVPVPYTPSVVFSTPVPNTSTRRGGRGGGRGNAQGNGRGAPNGVNGAVAADRDSAASASLPNGDQSRRGRSDGAVRDLSPSEGKRTGSAEPPSWRDNGPAPVAGDKPLKSPSAADAENASGKSATFDENASHQLSMGQNNSQPRSYQSNRPKQGRKFDGPMSAGNQRKDVDITSPVKDNTSNSFGRRTSTTQPDEEGEKRSTISEGQASQNKAPSGDRRTGQFSSFSGRDRPDRGRGGMRGGRGGSHTYQSPHHPNNHHFTNGHTQQPQNSSTFPLARSPTTFHPEQQNYFVPVSQHTRNYRGNGPRSQSVTSDSFYGRMPSVYPGGPQPLAPIQTYMGQMYDYPIMQPMSAMPFSPYGEQNALFSMVSLQIEYYFSVDNLCKDLFLRKHMDSKGFVFLSVIANFNRMKNLTTDLELIRLVCYQSRSIEFRVGVDGKDRLRRREGWEQFILNMPERDPTAQNDGPAELHNPPVPHPQGFDPFAPRFPGMPLISPTSPGPISADGVFQPINGIHPGVPVNGMITENGINGLDGMAIAPIETVNGNETLPPYQGPGGQDPVVNGEGDSFSDEQVEALSVIVRKQEAGQHSGPPPAASRTFSNGSIDSRSGVPEESSKLENGHSTLRVNGTIPSQGGDGIKNDGYKRSTSPFSPNQSPPLNPVRLFWVKDKDTPVESLPAAATYESYTDLRSKALEQRYNAPTGNCPYDMDVLYQFWSHFLIRNFNTRMYDEFRRFAFEDTAQKLSDVGMRNLIKYYGESLLSHATIRERIARHYVDLVKSENSNISRLAFKQLRSAWRNGTLNLKNRKKISDFIDSDLRNQLEK